MRDAGCFYRNSVSQLHVTGLLKDRRVTGRCEIHDLFMSCGHLSITAVLYDSQVMIFHLQNKITANQTLFDVLNTAMCGFCCARGCPAQRDPVNLLHEVCDECGQVHVPVEYSKGYL